MARDPFRAKGPVNDAVVRSVDWHLFELSASLLTADTEEGMFQETLAWFQPRHAEEVIEERFNMGLCGYPLCNLHLTSERDNRKGNSRRVLSSSSPTYRIDYKTKQIYEIEKSRLYCSIKCLEQSELWINQLDSTLPYGREVARRLMKEKGNKTSTASGGMIDDVLSVLQQTDVESFTKANNTARSEKQQKQLQEQLQDQLEPLPAFHHPSMSNTGEVLVKGVIPGQSILLDTNTSYQVNDQPKDDSQRVDKSDPSGAVPVRTNLEEMFATMRALQIKHGLLPTAPTAISSGDNVSPPIAESMDIILKGKQEIKELSRTSQITGNDGLDQISSVNNSKVSISDIPPVNDSQKTATDLTSEGRSNAVNKTTRRKTVEWNLPVAENAMEKQSRKRVQPRPAVAMSMNVIERPSAVPLSAAALLTKKEPAADGIGQRYLGDIEGHVPLSYDEEASA